MQAIKQTNKHKASKKHGKGHKSSKMRNPSKLESQNESRSLVFPSRVATVAILGVGTSMHAARARMHRPTRGRYERVDPRKETRLENTENDKRNKR